MERYRLTQLTDPNSNGAGEMLRALRDDLLPTAAGQGHQCWGLFAGLFGLPTNDLYLMTGSSPEAGDTGPDLSPFRVAREIILSPTVRPQEFSPPAKPGVYVFRWFEVSNRDVDEIARLSHEAWVTFEESFDSEVQGLFAETDRTNEDGTMLLVTWYRDLSVWERSRMPPTEARELFLKRHRLTRRATPIATRLLAAD